MLDIYLVGIGICFYKGTGLSIIRASQHSLLWRLVFNGPVTLHILMSKNLAETFYLVAPARMGDETPCLLGVPFYRLS